MVNRFRRVLILADESADWIIAGLRQLDRLALSIDEFAIENNETAPVLVCIFWRSDLDQVQRWTPKHERMTRVAFTTELDGEPFDLVLNTRLFLYRNAMRQLVDPSAQIVSPLGGKDSWENTFREVGQLSESQEGAWEYLTHGNQIDEIEIKFLKGSGKSQDGFVSRYLNRPISRVVTRLLLRFPTTPNAWTLFILPIPIVASLILLQGTYGSFLLGVVLFQIFSILDGCDGEIARAKFLESKRGSRLDYLCDVFGNILLAVALGFGLSRQSNPTSWFYLDEGLITGALIGANEFLLARSKAGSNAAVSLGGALYPRHRELVERSGMLLFGKKFAFWLIQLTKRDVAMLFFVFLAAIGLPALILHLLLVVTAVTLALSLKARSAL
ncbi:MAG: 1L-myo-inositol 1-phosphate cytidylyltransferase / CDP-L-myo-inositol myo-inositolphosphotransferase [Verrucomicrobiota bacterium]|jgi:phosphatidylglycerophosphate synthase